MEKSSIVLLLISFAFAAYRFFSRKRKTIKQPRLGILDFSNGEYASDIAADKTILDKLFHSSSSSVAMPPVCDVLIIYGHVESAGNIRNSASGLREIIRASKAAIVIIATENPANNYIQAAKRKQYGQANLVMTLNRKGDVFAQFLEKLFGAMKQGIPMPVAWVKLAPQIPGTDHKDCPDTIFACELGQITFA